jgi:hypothetical protein
MAQRTQSLQYRICNTSKGKRRGKWESGGQWKRCKHIWEQMDMLGLWNSTLLTERHAQTQSNHTY